MRLREELSAEIQHTVHQCIQGSSEGLTSYLTTFRSHGDDFLNDTTNLATSQVNIMYTWHWLSLPNVASNPQAAQMIRLMATEPVPSRTPRGEMKIPDPKTRQQTCSFSIQCTREGSSNPGHYLVTCMGWGWGWGDLKLKTASLNNMTPKSFQSFHEYCLSVLKAMITCVFTNNA